MLEASQIDKMSVTERLQAMEQLWDALRTEVPEVQSPQWHNEVLKERKERAERGEAKFLTLEQVRTRLR